MIYIFEDHKDEAISILFKSLYNNTSNKLIFSGGSGNIESELRKAVKEVNNKGEKEYITVFIDLIPDNSETAYRLMELMHLSNRLYDKIIIVPLVCAEFYFIKSINEFGLITDQKAVDRCISRIPHKNDELIIKMGSKKAQKSFEKYCKLLEITHLIGVLELKIYHLHLRIGN